MGVVGNTELTFSGHRRSHLGGAAGAVESVSREPKGRPLTPGKRIPGTVQSHPNYPGTDRPGVARSIPARRSELA